MRTGKYRVGFVKSSYTRNFTLADHYIDFKNPCVVQTNYIIQFDPLFYFSPPVVAYNSTPANNGVSLFPILLYVQVHWHAIFQRYTSGLNRGNYILPRKLNFGHRNNGARSHTDEEGYTDTAILSPYPSGVREVIF